MRAILCAAMVVGLGGGAWAADGGEVIVQFNGEKVGKVAADSKEKEFKAVFEKELKAIADKLPGKVKLEVSSMFTIINAGAVKWTGGDAETEGKLKAALEKLPFVKMVELSRPTPPPGK
jgi:hypothetical protein